MITYYDGQTKNAGEDPSERYLSSILPNLTRHYACDPVYVMICRNDFSFISSQISLRRPTIRMTFDKRQNTSAESRDVLCQRSPNAIDAW